MHNSELQEQLKNSKEYVESQGRNFESREERHYRLLNQFEKRKQTDKLELDCFYN